MSFRHFPGDSAMAEELFVATRKGLFLVEGDGRQAPRNLGFLGDPVSAFLEDRRDGCLYAALNLGHFGAKLHRSEDGGASWTELPVPAFPVGLAADGEARSEEHTSELQSLMRNSYAFLLLKKNKKN